MFNFVGDSFRRLSRKDNSESPRSVQAVVSHPIQTDNTSQHVSDLVGSTRTSQNDPPPAQRLPAELLELVFLHYDGHQGDYHTLHWKDLPWSISQVSRVWRDVSLRLPPLWNRIPCANPIKKARNGMKKAEAAVSELIRRSGSAPLTLSYSAPGMTLKKFDDPVLDLLVANSERWDTANIEMTSQSLVRVLRAVEEKMPQLRRLTLQLGSSKILWFINIFLRAPSLAEVILIDFPTRNVALRWQQLTFFREVTKNGTEVLLSNGPGDPFGKLKRLELTRYNDGPTTFGLEILPHLTILRVRFGARSNGASILSRLITPVLEELTIFRFPSNPILAATQLIQRSGPSMQASLKKLSLERGVWGVHALCPGIKVLLELTPALEQLELLCQMGSDDLDCLYPSDSSILVPYLQFLHLAQSLDYHYTPVEFIAMERCNAGVSPPNDGSPTLLAPRQFRRLETFRLSFGRHAGSHSQGIFEGDTFRARCNDWLPSHHWDKAEKAKELKECSKVLLKEIPGLRNGSLPLSPFGRQARRIDDVLTKLEDSKVDHPLPLYWSSLHHFMDWIAYKGAPKDIPGEERFNIKARARALLERWEPLLRAGAKNMRWVNVNKDRLWEVQYVGEHHFSNEESYHDVYARLAKPNYDHGEEFIPQYMQDLKVLEDPRLPVIA